MKQIHIIDLYNILCVGAYGGRTKSYATQSIPTGGIYQVLQRIRKIRPVHKDDVHIVIVTDSKNNIRKNKYEVYKANRGLYDDKTKKIQRKAVHLQEELLKDLFERMNIPVFEVDGYEADDLAFNIMLSLAYTEGNPLYDYQVYMHTSDGDWIGNMMLAPDNVFYDCTTYRSRLAKVKTYREFTNLNNSEPDYEYFHRMIYGDKADNYKGLQSVFSSSEIDLIYDKVEEYLVKENLEFYAIGWDMEWWKEFLTSFAGTDERKIRGVLESVELAFPYTLPQIADIDIRNQIFTKVNWKAMYQFTDLFQIKLFEKELGKVSKFSDEKVQTLTKIKLHYRDRYKEVFESYEGLKREIREPLITQESLNEIYDNLYKRMPKVNM